MNRKRAGISLSEISLSKISLSGTNLNHGVKNGVLMAISIALFIAPSMATAQPKPKLAEVIRGPVELKRGSGEYRFVGAGTELYSGDLLRARRGSIAEIQCVANRTTWTVPDNGLPWGVANVCPSPSTSFNRRRNSSFFQFRR